MPGYVAIAFVEPSTRRIARPVRDEPQAPPTGAIEPTRLEDVRVVRSVSSDQVRERGAALRRVWAQTTFYLFDPESWR
ncbi:MAG TPA: hypothetical protein VLR93_01320 [Patescibacteria group bacterium]|jgi:hypothetical protein|nr:hypothetical protein [Patescibacteria group bacterium]